MPEFLRDLPSTADRLPPMIGGTAREDWSVLLRNGDKVLPNVNDWRPGDIFLVSAREGSFRNWGIRRFQASCRVSPRSAVRIAARDAAAIHVAIYDGEQIWDIAPRSSDQSQGDVRRRTVGSFFDISRCYAIVRFRSLDLDRDRLVRFLEAGIDTVRYWDNRFGIVRLLAARRKGQVTTDVSQVSLCSTYLRKALNYAAAEPPTEVLVLPADFSAAGNTNDRIDVDWYAAESA